jgi:GTP-binding protein HflX
MEAVEETLTELEVDRLPMVIALNKADLLAEDNNPFDDLPHSAPAVLVSARTGQGIEDLLMAIEAAMVRLMEPVDVLLPYERGELLSLFYQRGQVNHEEHTEAGVRLHGRLPRRLVALFASYETA